VLIETVKSPTNLILVVHILDAYQRADDIIAGIGVLLPLSVASIINTNKEKIRANTGAITA